MTRSPPRRTSRTPSRSAASSVGAEVAAPRARAAARASAAAVSGGGLTRTARVVALIRDRVAARQLTVGDRLPSIRRLADGQGVSPSTVVEAYERLAASGLIRARRGSGFYVVGDATPALAMPTVTSPRARAVDPFWVSRQSLDADATMLMPGCGWLPPDWLPTGDLRRAMRAVARGSNETLTVYGSSRGSIALRQWLRARWVDEGIDLAPDQVMLAASGTQAIDLILRFLLRPGDAVLVDDPCYFNFRALLRAHPVRVVSVPRTPSGPDAAAFATVVARERPRIYLTNSGLHNPTGGALSPRVAHQVLSIAAEHDVVIVEDEIFADLEPEISTRFAVLDGLERVIRIGSFSKTLSASVRCGYIAARADWIEGLVDLQVATGFGGPSPVAAELIAHVLAGGGYRRHLESLHHRLARARRERAQRLQRLGIVPWLMPRGGFFLWCRLPDGRDAAELSKAVLQQKVLLAPGNVFSLSQCYPDFLRFNVTQCIDPRVFDVLAGAMSGPAGSAT